MNMRQATQARIADLATPDVALAALAFTLADLLDDPDTATAACAKEYRATIQSLVNADEAARVGSLDDI